MLLTPTFVAGRALAHASAMTAVTAFLWTAAPANAHTDGHLENLVERVAPSVVTVLSSEDAPQQMTGGENSPFADGTPFDDLFRRFGRPDTMPKQFGENRPRQSLGSGFILEEDGWIVTNHHVVEGADTVTVRLKDKREFEAEVIGVDQQTDLALLRIDAGGPLPHITLGDSGELRVGEPVFAVGNPFGLGGTVTSGIVSATGRDIAAGPYAEFIQTDTAINRGNSGGPLFNMVGEVIGVNSAIYSPNGGSVGVGFAVASNIVERVVADLKADGGVSRGWLGVTIQDVDPDMAAALDLDTPTGALVASVSRDGPSNGILEAGDVILGFNGDSVTSSNGLPKLVAAVSSGSTVPVSILRADETRTVEVTIGTLDKQQQAALAEYDASDASASEALGATVSSLTPEARAELGLSDDVIGVVVTSLESRGPASKAGIQVGDVIVRLGSENVTSPDALDLAVTSQGNDPALMLINRQGNQLFVAITIA